MHFLILFQIVSLVSSDPVNAAIASLAALMLVSMIVHASFLHPSLIPLYAIAWMIVANFAPCRSYSSEMLRDRVSGAFFDAPSFTSLPHSSLLQVPW